MLFPKGKQPMLTMLGSPRRCCDGLTRRETLTAGLYDRLWLAREQGWLKRTSRLCSTHIQISLTGWRIIQ